RNPAHDQRRRRGHRPARRPMVDLDRRRRALGPLRAHGRDHRGGAVDPDRGADGGSDVTSDQRVEAYAALLVEKCLDVQPRWQVLLVSSPLARPLIEAVTRQIARRGAYVLPRLSLNGSLNVPWVLEAPEELLSAPPPIDIHAYENADALIAIEAPVNTREALAVPSERLALHQAGLRPHMERMFTYELKWVGCQFPTPALAQDAGMSVSEFEDFLYGACLLDWDAERRR